MNYFISDMKLIVIIIPFVGLFSIFLYYIYLRCQNK